MRENQACPPRTRGRPQLRSDEETLRLVIEAASAGFLETGYAGTGMGEVAQRAGVSTKTLYRLIPSKEALFRTVVTDRTDRFLLDIDEEALAGLDLAQALERILTAYGALSLAPDTVAMIRLVLGEGSRFPELAAAFYESAIEPTRIAMAAWLERQCARGLIRLDDLDEAAGLLRGMMALEPQRAAMLGQRAALEPEEIARRARACARLFLDGCRV
jgi:AcrR family transcriptional regulator